VLDRGLVSALLLVGVVSWIAAGAVAQPGVCAGLPDDLAGENDTCDASVPIGAGRLSGLLVTKGDDDWYRLTVPTFTRAYVQVIFTSADGDIDLRQYADCGGAEVAASLSRTDNEQLLIATTHTGRDVHFKVEMFASASSDCNAYELVVSFEPGTPGFGYCPAQINSSGFVGRIVGDGSSSINTNDLILVAGPIPSGVPGLIFHGPRQSLIPFGNGVRCVTGPIRRSAIMSASGTNLFWDIDNGAVPEILQGATRYFQCWFRDGGDSFGYGLSSGYGVTFTE